MKVNFFRNWKDKEITGIINWGITILPVLLVPFLLNYFFQNDTIVIIGVIAFPIEMIFFFYVYRIYNNALLEISSDSMEIKIKDESYKYYWRDIKEINFYEDDPYLKSVALILELKEPTGKQVEIIIDRYKFEHPKKRYNKLVDALKKINSEEFKAVRINFDVAYFFTRSLKKVQYKEYLKKQRS